MITRGDPARLRAYRDTMAADVARRRTTTLAYGEAIRRLLAAALEDADGSGAVRATW